MNKLEKYLLQRVQQLEAQLALYKQEFTPVRSVEETRELLKAGQLDETIIKMRTKNKTVQLIADEIGISENKRDLERRITELKKQKRIAWQNANKKFF